MLWLVEPHSDDIFLSLHQHIVGPFKLLEKTIITVFSDKKRKAESELYAEAVNCQHACLMGFESNGLKRSAGKIPKNWPPFKNGDKVILPLGLQHPEHIKVSNLPISSTVELSFYLDSPYFAKQKLADQVQELLEGMCIESFLQVNKRKWSHIEKFKSQSKFFYFNPPDKLPQIEMVVRNNL